MIPSVAPTLLALVSERQPETVLLIVNVRDSLFILLFINISRSPLLGPSDSYGHPHLQFPYGYMKHPPARSCFLEQSIIAPLLLPLLSTAFRPSIRSQSILDQFCQRSLASGPRTSRTPAVNTVTTILSTSSMDQLLGPVSVVFSPELFHC